MNLDTWKGFRHQTLLYQLFKNWNSTTFQLWKACLSKYSCKLSKLGTKAVCTSVCVSIRNITVEESGHSGVNPSAALACPLTVKHANKHAATCTHTGKHTHTHAQALADNAFLWWEMIALDYKHYICCHRQSRCNVYISIMLFILR